MIVELTMCVWSLLQADSTQKGMFECIIAKFLAKFLEKNTPWEAHYVPSSLNSGLKCLAWTLHSSVPVKLFIAISIGNHSEGFLIGVFNSIGKRVWGIIMIILLKMGERAVLFSVKLAIITWEWFSPSSKLKCNYTFIDGDALWVGIRVQKILSLYTLSVEYRKMF